jgi:hypothetical protein
MLLIYDLRHPFSEDSLFTKGDFSETILSDMRIETE